MSEVKLNACILCGIKPELVACPNGRLKLECPCGQKEYSSLDGNEVGLCSDWNRLNPPAPSPAAQSELKLNPCLNCGQLPMVHNPTSAKPIYTCCSGLRHFLEDWNMVNPIPPTPTPAAQGEKVDWKALAVSLAGTGNKLLLLKGPLFDTPFYIELKNAVEAVNRALGK